MNKNAIYFPGLAESDDKSDDILADLECAAKLADDEQMPTVAASVRTAIRMLTVEDLNDRLEVGDAFRQAGAAALPEA